jgi:hypothetical protein
VLKKSARKEFEKSKFEKDPQKLAEMLVSGRDCLQQFFEKVSFNPTLTNSPHRLILEKRNGERGCSTRGLHNNNTQKCNTERGYSTRWLNNNKLLLQKIRINLINNSFVQNTV